MKLVKSSDKIFNFWNKKGNLKLCRLQTALYVRFLFAMQFQALYFKFFDYLLNLFIWKNTKHAQHCIKNKSIKYFLTNFYFYNVIRQRHFPKFATSQKIKPMKLSFSKLSTFTKTRISSKLINIFEFGFDHTKSPEI